MEEGQTIQWKKKGEGGGKDEKTTIIYKTLHRKLKIKRYRPN
jgi:hypothetical protein